MKLLLRVIFLLITSSLAAIYFDSYFRKRQSWVELFVAVLNTLIAFGLVIEGMGY